MNRENTQVYRREESYTPIGVYSLSPFMWQGTVAPRIRACDSSNPVHATKRWHTSFHEIIHFLPLSLKNYSELKGL